MSDTLADGGGGGVSQTSQPVCESEAVGNCLGTGVQLDFSVVFISSLLEFMPQREMPFLYRILLNGLAASSIHRAGRLVTSDIHLLSQLRSTFPPSYIMPSH